MSTPNLGIKILDLKNWNEPDLPLFTNGLQGADWIGLVIQPKLNPGVSKDIHTLFEVARAAFAYSWFYMPLTQLGAEQCFRVVEAAVREKCEQVGLPVQKTTKKRGSIPTSFNENILALLKHGTISIAEEQRLQTLRKLRNMGSHPKFQTIMPPGYIIGTLVRTAEQINSLFP